MHSLNKKQEQKKEDFLESSQLMKTKIYHELSQMEPFLRDGVERLLWQEVPSLDWLQRKDQLHHGQIYYHLFFHAGLEEPIGAARITKKTFTDSRKPRSLLQKLLAPTPSLETWIGIQFPGASGHGLVVSSEHEGKKQEILFSIINTLIKDSPKLIQLTTPDTLPLSTPQNKVQKTDDCKFNTLPKNRPSLSTELERKIEAEIKFLTASKDYKLIHGSHWEELLQNSPSQAQGLLAKKMKDHLGLSCYKNSPTQYIALFYGHRPLTIAPLTKGRKGQAFGEILYNLDYEIDSSLTLLVLKEMMKVFENNPQLNTLSLINTLNLPRDLQRDLPLAGFIACQGTTYLISRSQKKKMKRRQSKKQSWIEISP